MKKRVLLSLILIWICISLFGRKYFVDPNGSNSNPGTIDLPFSTWEYLGAVLTPGDTGYIRGGTYYCKKITYDRYRIFFSNLNGTPDNMIKIWAYPGEYPVMDFTGDLLRNTPILFFMKNCNYCHIRGLRLTNATQPSDRTTVMGWSLIESSNNLIENCTLDHIGGYGFLVDYDEPRNSVLPSENNTFLNCDAYEISDPLSPSPYDGSNGFSITWTDKANGTTFRGCRAWYISDDGFDSFRGHSQNIKYENCWSFRNGWVNGIERYGGAMGNGYKLGPLPTEIPNDNFKAHTLVNCIAADNTDGGFVCYGLSGELSFTSCLSFSNGFYGFIVAGTGDALITLYNNLAFDEGIYNYNEAVDNWGDHRFWIEDSNVYDNLSSFVPPNIFYNVDNNEFVSIDVMELARPRKPDGSLPDVDFGHLIPESVLIDTGVVVGYPYVGKRPDIGAFETGFGGLAAVPEYQSSYVENPRNKEVILVFNLRLSSSIIPSPSDFNLAIGSEFVNIISVRIEGSNVILLIDREIEAEDIISVSYIQPLTNRLQTAFGGEANSFENKRVANLIGYEESPNLISALIYPNPTNDVFYIQLFGDPPSNDLTIRVYSTSGSIIHQEPLIGGSSIVNVSIDPLPGTYIVEIGSHTETLFAQKLIVN